MEAQRFPPLPLRIHLLRSARWQRLSSKPKGQRWLDLAHKKLAAAVAAAYGWPPDLSDEQILEWLLALNLERAAEEAKAVKVKDSKTSREKRTDEML